MDDSNGRSASTSRIGGLEQLGRYELICVMSRAEYGSTWAAIATSPPNMGEVYCLRRIVVSPGDEEQVIEPLMKTANDWEGVVRPGMLPVVDAVALSGRVGIVTQYLEGEPLRSVINLARVRKLPMPQGVALRIATDLVQSLVNLLGAALKKPELSKSTHGGVLPDVVLLGSNGETRITEAGVTAEIAKLPALMRHEKLLAYQAPEQLSGGKVDARTDVFAVGVLLWEMLSGQSLFLPGDAPKDADKVAAAVRTNVRDKEAPRLDDSSLGIEPAIDKDVADVVERALQKKASSRFHSLQEMATALRKGIGLKSGSRKDVAAYLSELLGSTLATRKAAIERASLTAPPAPVPAVDSEPPGERPKTVEPVGDVDIDVDMDFGDGDDLEELEPEATGEHRRPPVPPRIEIKSAPAKPKWPAPPSLLGEKGTPRPGASSRPGQTPKPSEAVEAKVKPESAPEDEPTVVSAADEGEKEETGGGSEEAKQVDAQADKEPETAEGQDAPTPEADVPNPFEQPFADEPAAKASPEAAPEGSQETAPEGVTQAASQASPEAALEPLPGRDTPIPTGDESESPPPAPVLATPEALDDFDAADDAHAAADRKRKSMYIVGGVVGVAAILLIAAAIASMGDDDGTETPAPSATPPPVPTVTQTAAPTATASAEPDAGAQTDAALDADAAEDAAKDAEEEKAEPAPKKPPPRWRPPKKPPKPYTPSEI